MSATQPTHHAPASPGRVNDFARKLGTDAPYLAGTVVKVQFTDGMDRKAFFDGDRVVLRLRRDDPDEERRPVLRPMRHP